MRTLLRLFARLGADKRAVTALEYGLIAAVIGGVVITASTRFGSSLTSAYATISAGLTTTVAGM